jgi:hypothetical protein
MNKMGIEKNFMLEPHTLNKLCHVTPLLAQKIY